MAYIIGVIVIGLIFTALHYFTEISKSQKIVATLILLVTIVGAISYNNHKTSQREAMLDVVQRYTQGKVVTCRGRDVSSVNFSLSVGTYTFIGNKNGPNYTQMISVSECN